MKDFENIMYCSLVLQQIVLSQGEIILLVGTLVFVHLSNMSTGILAFNWQHYFHFPSNGREILNLTWYLNQYIGLIS